MKVLSFLHRLVRALFLVFYTPSPVADPRLYRWLTGEQPDSTPLFT
ncbi:MAG: hypothetical protein ACRYFX_18590 [Janthinobacterium lividum]